MQTYTQDVGYYIDSQQQVMTAEQQQQAANNYLQHCFSPWTDQ